MELYPSLLSPGTNLTTETTGVGVAGGGGAGSIPYFLSLAPGASYLKRKRQMETISATAASGSSSDAMDNIDQYNGSTTGTRATSSSSSSAIHSDLQPSNTTTSDVNIEEKIDDDGESNSFFDNDVDSFGSGPVLM